MRVFNPRVRIEEKSVRQFSKGSAKERGRVVRCKMATRPSPEIEEYWPKKVLPNWGRKKSRSSTLGEEVNRHLCTQASHRWRELWRVLQESRKNFGKKKENRGRERVSGSRQLFHQGFQGWEKENFFASREGEGERKSDGKLVREKFYDR